MQVSNLFIVQPLAKARQAEPAGLDGDAAALDESAECLQDALRTRVRGRRAAMPPAEGHHLIVYGAVSGVDPRLFRAVVPVEDLG